jgi:glycosyltransferase involved in cell wall biosynthesis
MSNPVFKNIVFHLPHNIGNNVYPLSVYQNTQNLESKTLFFEDHRFLYPTQNLIKNSGNESFIRTELSRVKWFVRIALQADILHFHFGQTIATLTPLLETGKFHRKCLNYLRHFYLLTLQCVELFVYRITRKQVFFHFQGDDVRNGQFIQGSNPQLFENAPPGYYTRKSDEFKRRQVRRFNQVAKKFYFVNPDLVHELPVAKSTFIPYSNLMKLPAKSDIVAQRKLRLAESKIRICHAPSNRHLKGTKYVIEVMQRICSKHSNVEFFLVENLDFDEALEAYKSADLLIDQLLYGWYGGVAVEAMSLGVPVVAYLKDFPSNLFPEGFLQEMPILNASIENLEAKIIEFINFTTNQRIDLIEKSLCFVTKWHMPEYTANLILSHYQD